MCYEVVERKRAVWLLGSLFATKHRCNYMEVQFLRFSNKAKELLASHCFLIMQLWHRMVCRRHAAAAHKSSKYSVFINETGVVVVSQSVWSAN